MNHSIRCWACEGRGVTNGVGGMNDAIDQPCWQCKGTGTYPNRKPYCGTTNPEHKQAMERQRPAIIKRPWWDRLVRWLNG